MSSKTAKYYYRRYNWKEINNLFCYDVIFPERLSQKQQILRLYKNSLRRVYDNEIMGVRAADLHEYARGCREVRNDFEKLKEAKTKEEVEEVQDKYEYFIETTYQTVPIIRDNVAYEWRHGKGLIPYTDNDLAQDPHGYYSQNRVDFYPNPVEYEFRDALPFDDYANLTGFTANGWEGVELNDSSLKSHSAESPDAFKKRVEDLKAKYNKEVDVWEKDRH